MENISSSSNNNNNNNNKNITNNNNSSSSSDNTCNLSEYFKVGEFGESPSFYAIVSCLLVTIVLLNSIAAYTVWKVASMRKCSIMRLFTVTFLANMVAACSYFIGQFWICMNLIGSPPDEFFFFYLSVSFKMTILVTNTYKRKYALTCMAKKFPKIRSCETNFMLVKRYIVPCLIVSSIKATVAVVTKLYSCVPICYIILAVVLPLLVLAIYLNLVLQMGLKETTKLNEKYLNSKESVSKLKKARNIILTIVYFQCVLVFFWSAVTVLKLVNYVNMGDSSKNWLIMAIISFALLTEPLALLIQQVKARYIKSSEQRNTGCKEECPL